MNLLFPWNSFTRQACGHIQICLQLYDDVLKLSDLLVMFLLLLFGFLHQSLLFNLLPVHLQF